MKRQSSETESMVYAYGCGTPISGVAQAEQEIRRSNELWNTLVAIERAYDAEVLDAACQGDRDVATARVEMDAARAELHAAYGAQDRDAIAAARSRLRQSERDLWPPLAKWRKEHQSIVREIELRRRARVVDARRKATAWWPNYNDVIQRYDTARIEVRKRGRSLRMHDDSVDEGCLTVQIQRTRSGLGAAPSELQDGTCSMLAVGRVPEGAYDATTFRGDRRRMCQVMMEMRVDSDGNTLRLPVWMHRPLPADCRIKQARIVWRREGNHRRYGLRLTISRPRREAPPHSSALSAIVRIDIQMRGRHLQVARVETHGADGAVSIGDVVLDAHWVAMMDRAAWLQSRLDNESVGAKERVRAAMERPGLIGRLIRRRTEQYRLFARALAAAHRAIRIETPALSEVAFVDRGSEANAMRHRACAHRLIAEIQHQARKHGAQVDVAVTHASAPVPRRVRKREINGLRAEESAKKGALEIAAQDAL